jgi:competence protein ComEC
MAGIIIQTFGSFHILSFGLLILPACLLLVTAFLKGKPQFACSARWTWGAVYACLLIFVAIQTTAYHQASTQSTPGRLEQWATVAQQRLIAPIDKLNLPEAAKSTLSTITVGCQTAMPKEIQRQFSLTGVVHILSVSGFHVAIVCGFLSMALSFLSFNNAGKWIRYILIMLLLWTFTAISGLAPASVRSAVMLSFYLTGRQLDRTTDGYNTLAASAFCMLVYNPLYLYNIGFQLSYIAVASIRYIQPRLDGLIEIRNPLLKTPWEWITVTLAAQTGVTFLSLYYFGQFSTVFLLANLPLILISTLLIPVALLWLLLPTAFPGYTLLQHAVEALTQSMMWVVDSFSHIPGSSLTFHFTLPMMLLSYTALFLFFLLLRRKTIWR